MECADDTLPRNTWRLLATATVAVISLSIHCSLAAGSTGPCDGVFLADGTCVENEPGFDPEHSNEGAFDGGSTGTVADTAVDLNEGNLRDGGGFNIPTGAKPSPLFGAQPFTQQMFREEEFGFETLPVTTAIVADVSVRSKDPDDNFGDSDELEVDGSSAKHTFIRVTVNGVGGNPVTSATLRLQVAGGSSAASNSGGRIHKVMACSWDENTMTWNTRPTIDGPVLDTVGAVDSGDVVEFDVTSAISGDGTFCLGMDSLSSNGVDYNSREAASGAPVLIVNGSGGGSNGGNCTPSFPEPPNAQSGPDGTALDTFLAAEICPSPTRQSNDVDPNPWQSLIETFLGRPLDDPPAEGRPPGEDWAHQRWDEFPPQVYTKTAQAGARDNGGLRSPLQLHEYSVGEFAPGGLYHNTVGEGPGFAQFNGTTKGIEVRFHPDMPVQDPLALWAFDGTLPPKLMMARYGVSMVFRHYDALPVDPSANYGFGLHTLTTHEHNGHVPSESDGYTQAFFFPGQFYDYRWPMIVAGHDTINTGATDPKAGAPDGQGGITPVPGDWREIMSSHWFHDHMLDFTAPNVYKGNAALMNYYSSLDRGREPASAAEATGSPANPGYGCHYEDPGNPNNVNLCLPSGSALDWGNRDYDVNLVIADKAWDEDGQLFFNIFNLDGFLGDQLLTNWQYKPYFNVRARKYRFRILNGAVARYFALAFVTESGQSVPVYMIANDGNVMEHTVLFPDGILPTQSIGERYDIIIDFSQFPADTKIRVLNVLEHRNGRRPHVKIPVADILSGDYQPVIDGDRWRDGDPAVGEFLEFRVVNYAGDDRSMDPAEYLPGGKKMIELPTYTQTELDNAIHRTFSFGRSSGTDEKPWTIKTDGGQGISMDPRRLSAAPERDTLEVWHIENGGGGWSHPIHIHFEEGLILQRDGGPPPEWERWARKDMYRVGRMPDSGDSVDVAIRFREFMGTFMEHCHNTQHEDHAMLLRFDIENPGQCVAMPTPMPTWDGVEYVDSIALPTARTGDLDYEGGPTCGDGVRNQPGEQCDGADAAACPGICQGDCTCPGPAVCGDNLVNQIAEECDGTDDGACPGVCLPDCMCGAVLPMCGDGMVNHVDEDCDGADDTLCPGACQPDCECSAATTTTTSTTTTSTTTTTLAGIATAVLADVRTEAKNSDENFGADDELSTDASSEKNTFIRVVVTGTGGSVGSATIRMTVPDVKRADSNSGGRIERISDCGWNEDLVTFDDQPTLDGIPGPDIGPVERGDVVDFDVTAHVPGDGTYCFAITNDSSNGADYNSREAASGQPEFIVTP